MKSRNNCKNNRGRKRSCKEEIQAKKSQIWESQEKETFQERQSIEKQMTEKEKHAIQEKKRQNSCKKQRKKEKLQRRETG